MEQHAAPPFTHGMYPGPAGWRGARNTGAAADGAHQGKRAQFDPRAQFALEVVVPVSRFIHGVASRMPAAFDVGDTVRRDQSVGGGSVHMAHRKRTQVQSIFGPHQLWASGA